MKFLVVAIILLVGLTTCIDDSQKIILNSTHYSDGTLFYRKDLQTISYDEQGWPTLCPTTILQHQHSSFTYNALVHLAACVAVQAASFHAILLILEYVRGVTGVNFAIAVLPHQSVFFVIGELIRQPDVNVDYEYIVYFLNFYLLYQAIVLIYLKVEITRIILGVGRRVRTKHRIIIIIAYITTSLFILAFLILPMVIAGVSTEFMELIASYILQHWINNILLWLWYLPLP